MRNPLTISFLCKGDNSLANVAVLFVVFSLDSGKIQIHVATIKMGLSIICLRGYR